MHCHALWYVGGCLMVLIFICMSGISTSLFSLWFCLESQSSINMSGPGLYMIQALYWCILSRIHCSLCDSVAMSLNIATSGMWSVMMLTYLTKQWWWNSSSQYSILSVPHSVLLYLFSMLVRLLLAKQWVWVCCCLMLHPLGQLVLLLVCSRSAPSQNPDASVSVELHGFVIKLHACIFFNDF